MPVYEYRCAHGHNYEKMEGFDAPAEHACPHCGGSARRQFSLPAVIFKGSGFYSTDNRKSGSFHSAQATSDGNGASSDVSSGLGHDDDHGSGSEAKPAPAPAD